MARTRQCRDESATSGIVVRTLDSVGDDATRWLDLLDLRARVLRPGQPKERSRFAGDDAPGAVHLGAFERGASGGDERLVGIASVMEENGLRLRGMAVEEDWRGRGVGAVLVRRVCALAVERDLPLWCHARMAAVGFYEKLGWVPEGERFDLPDIGPHVRMRWQRGNGPEARKAL
jgi:GNAT superfamily N-acetyltransferase